MAGFIRKVFEFGPLIFAFGFLAPLIMQVILMNSIALPFGLTPLWAGLGLAGAFGLTAQIRGRWL